MAIKEYGVFQGNKNFKCQDCGTHEDLVFDEDGDCFCTDCLFERESMERGIIETLYKGGKKMELAKIAYDAYGKTTNYKNFIGGPMPKWEDLPEAIQRAWINAANAVKDVDGTSYL